ncbi:MAG: hypothetical protein MI974_13280 [Chitinophagales bacterium]|nr:hypothetical protein [Chitinophagales bacterium]
MKTKYLSIIAVFVFFHLPTTSVQAQAVGIPAIVDFIKDLLSELNKHNRDLDRVLRKIENAPPNDDTIEMLDMIIKKELSNVSPKAKQMLPKSHRVAVALAAQKQFEFAKALHPYNKGLVADYCSLSKYYWRLAYDERKTKRDIYFLNNHEKALGFDSDDINPWIDSLIHTDQKYCTNDNNCINLCLTKQPVKVKSMSKLFEETTKYIYDYQKPTFVDSMAVLNTLDRFNKIVGGQDPNISEVTLIQVLSKGLLLDAKYFSLTGAWTKSERRNNMRTSLCSQAAPAWRIAMQIMDEYCEPEHEFSRCIIEQKHPSLTNTDTLKNWIKYRYHLARACSVKDTCKDVRAINGAPLLATYDHNPELCLYCGCTDSLYVGALEFMQKYPPDQIISTPDSCKTLRSIGCLDSAAVNYALDESFNAKNEFYKKYYKPEVNEHAPELCIYAACTDTCSPSYHPRAIEDDGNCKKICGCMNNEADNYNSNATHEDGSCIFNGGVNTEIIREKIIEYILEDDRYQAGIEYLIRNILKIENCNNNDNCLRIALFVNSDQVDAAKNKELASNIKFANKISGIKTGAYKYQVIDLMLEALTDFFQNSDYADFFANSSLSAKVLGEADGQKVRRSGIKYYGDFGGSISHNFSKVFANAPSSTLENIDAIRFLPQHQHIALTSGGLIKNNFILGFCRAYGVAWRLYQYRGDIDILIGAKANREIGGAYRKVFFVLDFGDFFANARQEAAPKQLEYERTYQNNNCLCEQ